MTDVQFSAENTDKFGTAICKIPWAIDAKCCLFEGGTMQQTTCDLV